MRIPTFTPAHAVVRYLVADLDRAVAFYTGPLGFSLEAKMGPIAIVARGELHLLLSGPQSSGARPMPDGRKQEPGGWNRLVLYVDDLAARIIELREAGVGFRNDVESGPGGSQILIEDPDGNLIELHEPPGATGIRRARPGSPHDHVRSVATERQRRSRRRATILSTATDRSPRS